VIVDSPLPAAFAPFAIERSSDRPGAWFWLAFALAIAGTVVLGSVVIWGHVSTLCDLLTAR
jgi:hypothetical protein